MQTQKRIQVLYFEFTFLLSGPYLNVIADTNLRLGVVFGLIILINETRILKTIRIEVDKGGGTR